MKAKKIVRYRIPVSRVFPATHPRKGENTHFAWKIITATEGTVDGLYMGKKLHTIRANYPLWAKRFEKINRGEAILELYYWTGKPYNSKTETIIQLRKEDGIGIQRLEFYEDKDEIPALRYPLVNNFAEPDIEVIAKNDGLSIEDFKSWFKGYDLSNPLAIIHFTKFRY